MALLLCSHAKGTRFYSLPVRAAPPLNALRGAAKILMVLAGMFISLQPHLYNFVDNCLPSPFYLCGWSRASPPEANFLRKQGAWDSSGQQSHSWSTGYSLYECPHCMRTAWRSTWADLYSLAALWWNAKKEKLCARTKPRDIRIQIHIVAVSVLLVAHLMTDSNQCVNLSTENQQTTSMFDIPAALFISPNQVRWRHP